MTRYTMELTTKETRRAAYLFGLLVREQNFHLLHPGDDAKEKFFRWPHIMVNRQLVFINPEPFFQLRDSIYNVQSVKGILKKSSIYKSIIKSILLYTRHSDKSKIKNTAYYIKFIMRTAKSFVKFYIHIFPLTGIKFPHEFCVTVREIVKLCVFDDDIFNCISQFKGKSDYKKLHAELIGKPVVIIRSLGDQDTAFEIAKYHSKLVIYCLLIYFFGGTYVSEQDYAIRIESEDFSDGASIHYFDESSGEKGTMFWRTLQSSHDINISIDDIPSIENDITINTILNICFSNTISKCHAKTIRAIRWFGEAYLDTDIDSKFIKYMIAMESIGDNHDNDIGRHLANEIGAIITYGDLSPTSIDFDIFNAIKQLYRLRGRIVHGGHHGEITTETIRRAAILTAMAVLNFALISTRYQDPSQIYQRINQLLAREGEPA
ncbi:MAG: hypothetical protein AB7D57_08930 [Desulfovibrionaceae bacterium]